MRVTFHRTGYLPRRYRRMNVESTDLGGTIVESRNRAFSDSGLPLEVCAPPAFLADGSNGILSWLGPITSGPDGLFFTLIARRTDESAPPLLEYEAQATLSYGDVEKRIGWGMSGRKSRAELTFSVRRPEDIPGPPFRFRLTVKDITGQAEWSTDLTLPIAE